MEDVTHRSLAELRAGMATGELDADRVIAAHLDKARSAGRELNAFTELIPAPVAGPGPLAGVPVAVKDAFVDAGRAPTMGSRVKPSGLSGTATLLQLLREAGAAVVGYANLHEWGIGTTSTITATGPIRNPWDTDRIAGGSSGGSAAAVAAGIVPVAIGTDAGGSVRIPAACCGVVGLKPTFGAIPLAGEVASISPVNHAGVIGRTVEDVATVFEVLAQQRLEDVETGGLVVGVPTSFFFDNVTDEVATITEDMTRVLGRAVHDVRSIELPGVERSPEVVSELLLPHMARLVARDMDERPEAFERRTLKALQRGAAMERRVVSLDGFRACWDRAFESCDVIVVPTLPALPPRIADAKVELPSGPALADLAQYALNAPMNTGGVPALAVPVGGMRGVPVSVTIVARRGAEDVVLATGRLLEDLLDGAYRNRVASGPDA